ncbi:galactokinase [Flagellimonas meridianipacifica]|uniref:Galactokinase n=1 Tax=Flagellimonas meridianipacifica TaxID=1080225 RepID=A0A2T0M8F4_9FLAO|nr:galactokinase [Allomuricauda pacifica]PRX53784.1 galactokinase [Allomuricauda pacifica]
MIEMHYSKKLNEEVQQKFKEHYGKDCGLLFSPGRINIIGEHTDYNSGFVMPGAIDKGIHCAFAKNNLNSIRMYSLDFDQELIISTDHTEPVATQWANYILGVFAILRDKKLKVSGFDMVFGGDIPIGSGLSSSAALENAAGFALNQLFDLQLNSVTLAKVGQQAEHEYAGVRCGIMDQFASALGKEDHVLQLDCQSLEFEYIPAHFGEYEIILFNSKVKHSLAESEYNMRRATCEEGVQLLQKFFPQVKSLRDATLEMLEQEKHEFSSETLNCCSYVIEENERVSQASEALRKGQLQKLGSLLFASHQGLSEKYRVSCDELDFLVDLAAVYPTIIGARMMGGGFGGCTINLVKKAAKENIIHDFQKAYRAKFQIELESYEVRLSKGTHIINSQNYE